MRPGGETHVCSEMSRRSTFSKRVRSDVADTAGEVAQTGSLLYRGLATRWALMFPGPTDRRRTGRLPAGDTADWQSCMSLSLVLVR